MLTYNQYLSEDYLTEAERLSALSVMFGKVGDLLKKVGKTDITPYLIQLKDACVNKDLTPKERDKVIHTVGLQLKKVADLAKNSPLYVVKGANFVFSQLDKIFTTIGALLKKVPFLGQHLKGIYMCIVLIMLIGAFVMPINPSLILTSKVLSKSVYASKLIKIAANGTGSLASRMSSTATSVA